MTDTIVRNSVPTAPVADLLFVSDYDSGLEVENLLHPTLNASGHIVVYRPARLRSGTMQLVFPTAAAAWAAVPILSGGYTYTLTADLTQLSMTFVLRPGRLRPRQGITSGRVWLLEIPFQEVA